MHQILDLSLDAFGIVSDIDLEELVVTMGIMFGGKKV